MNAIDNRGKWDAPQVERLTALWAEGKSCSEIAEIMGLVSRSAVIGKVHRLKLPRRARSQSESGRHSQLSGRGLSNNGKVLVARRARNGTPTQRYVERPPIIVPIEPPVNPPVRFADISRSGCRYIAGDPAGPETMMCGAQIQRRHLCAYHIAICWTPAPAKRTRAA